MTRRILPRLRACALAAGLSFAAVAPAALAQGPATQDTTTQGTATQGTIAPPGAGNSAQQERMRTCNAEAGTRGLAGDPRRAFMSECLAGRMPPPPAAAGRQPSTAQAAQQERMRSCNAEAGTRGLAAEVRRDFMSECLAGRMPAAPAAPRR